MTLIGNGGIQERPGGRQRGTWSDYLISQGGLAVPGKTGPRGTWSSRLGFILAASGSAIGLGNIVFFSANAYQYGAGAFYLPYLLALFLVGIPVIIMELGLGVATGRAFPEAMYRVGGRWGEFFGWFGVLNAGIISMYYITILAWVLGMLVGAFGALWQPAEVAAFGLPAGTLSDSMSFFFNMISGWTPVIFVIIVWALNALIIWWGTKSIEKAVRIFVPLMWLFMIVLIIRGLTLDKGGEGIKLLFTPNFSAMGNVSVWKGAFSQMFFTLSLGFGIMTTYASYLPRKSDGTGSGLMIATMNCSFEFIAGLAIFSLLFTFAIAPKASTLSMMFFVVPQGIANFPTGAALFGVLFFLLLLFAGLSSSVSLLEVLSTGLIDKYGISRKKAVLMVTSVGVVGSVCFALPMIVDPGLKSNGTLGLSLLDLMDHWAFSYGLLLMGLIECLYIGWVLGPRKLRTFLNSKSSYKLGAWFDVSIKYIIPAVLSSILLLSIMDELGKGIYGKDMVKGSFGSLHIWALFTWLLFTLGIAAILTRGRTYPYPPGTVFREDHDESNAEPAAPGSQTASYPGANQKKRTAP